MNPVNHLTNKKTRISSKTLRRALKNAGVDVNKCDVCNISDWCGKLITIEIHHIDGDNTNNNVSNIQLLCPNCHSQTNNFKAKKNAKPRSCARCLIRIEMRTKYCKPCFSLVKKENGNNNRWKKPEH